MKDKNLMVFVTDHSADFADTGNLETLTRLYLKFMQIGIMVFRTDIRWSKLMPNENCIDSEQLLRYKLEIETMSRLGMQPPIIVLSSIPDWAMRIYKKNVARFYDLYSSYLVKIIDILKDQPNKVRLFQVLNEINNPVYCKLPLHDVLALVGLTRNRLKSYNKDVKIMLSLVAGSLNDQLERLHIGSSAENYLDRLKEVTSGKCDRAADAIAVDFYPGLFHNLSKGHNAFGDLQKIEAIFRKLSEWECAYGLGEFGYPSKYGDDIKQSAFYIHFLKAFDFMVERLQKEGLKTPEFLGIYQAMDEAPRSSLEKILRRLPWWPQSDMGLCRSDGSVKSAYFTVGRYTQRNY